MESGHAYAKSLRTVKSCVGSTWCRYGIGDSVGMAVRLEERYKSIRSPHKMKGGVSGCVRECAEAQNKDFGLIASDKGFNIFVGGNGGATPKHSELLAKDVPPDDVVPVLDRYLMFYIRTADKLQRTARWLENLPGGIKYLREVILEDKLGICASLEAQMEELVGTFFDEWAEAVKDPAKSKQFTQFDNTTETLENMELEQDRGQTRPVFRVRGKYLASQQMCPHKRAFVLSDGLIGDSNDKLWVSCPYHKRNFELNGEDAGRCQNDEEVSIAVFPVEEREDGWVYLKLPPIHELDGVLGTKKWMVKKGESGEGPFEKLDRRIGKNGVGMKGRKPFEAKREMLAAGGPEKNGDIDW